MATALAALRHSDALLANAYSITSVAPYASDAPGVSRLRRRLDDTRKAFRAMVQVEETKRAAKEARDQFRSLVNRAA